MDCPWSKQSSAHLALQVPLTLMTCPPAHRRLHKAYNRVVDGSYGVSGLVGREIRGKTVGVLGTGAIGVEACRIFKVRDRGVGLGVRLFM